MHAADTTRGPLRARTAALVAVLLFTGARVCEVIGANVEDLGADQQCPVLGSPAPMAGARVIIIQHTRHEISGSPASTAATTHRKPNESGSILAAHDQPRPGDPSKILSQPRRGRS